jgi:hypothetical protein
MEGSNVQWFLKGSNVWWPLEGEGEGEGEGETPFHLFPLSPNKFT